MPAVENFDYLFVNIPFVGWLVNIESRADHLLMMAYWAHRAKKNARFKLNDDLKVCLTTTVERDSPCLYYIENYVLIDNVPKPEGYHVLFTVESYGRLTMYEKDANECLLASAKDGRHYVPRPSLSSL